MFGLCLCHRTKNLLALADFGINHNILATNYFLKKIKIIDDANCNFCQKENETIEHIFGGCENVQNLLGQVNSWFGDKYINQALIFFRK
jgi:hypothetical protein